MIGRLHHVAIDCPAPAALARFYSELIGMPITYESEEWVVVAANDRTSGLAFQLAPDHQPPEWPDPVRSQQFHLDVMVDDVAAAEPLVLALGARKLAGTVFADPAGHPFCLIPRPHWAPPIDPAAENREPDRRGTRHDAPMTWTAPEITRPAGSLVAGEREMLEGYLNFYRSTLLFKCAGLTAEQLAERAAPPSTLSLLGLIRHLTKVERTWFRIRFAGEPIEPVFAAELGRDADFELVDAARAQSEYEALLAEWRLADQAAAGRSLDDRFTFRDEEGSLRMIYLHLIGEYARHAGHADLVRERLDGVTGA